MRTALFAGLLIGFMGGCGGSGAAPDVPEDGPADVPTEAPVTSVSFGVYPSASLVVGQADFLDSATNQGGTPLAGTLAAPLGPLALGTENVTYQLTVANTWSTTSHPGEFPFEAHFSWLGGGTHDQTVSFWAVGELASPGVVQMAETGVTTLLTDDVAAMVTRGHAFGTLDWRWWFCPDETSATACGPMTVTVEVNEDFPRVTLLSMLGPSPDWFVGVSGLPLRDDSGFIDEVVVPLVSYDGGTRSANEWALRGPLNDPPEAISLITAASGQRIGPDPIGSFTFTRLGAVTPAPVYVADTLNNRVLGYVAQPAANMPDAAFALGQANLTSVTPGLGASGLREPATIASGSGRLAVADRGNNRVLLWATPPTTDGAAADVALGQVDMAMGDTGLGRAGLNAPAGVALADGRLIVADTGNNRVLIWNTLPTADGTDADLVLGQADFDSTVAAAGSGMDSPCGIWTDGVRLVVADRGNHRVLIWNNMPSTNGQAPDVVVGQSDADASDAGADASGLNGPCGVAADDVQLYVADSGNNRVLVYAFPSAHGAPATGVIGQGDFTHVAPNDDAQVGAGGPNPTARTLRDPVGVTIRGTRLFVVDAGNSRVLVFDGILN